jgi:hypothetical protein
MLPERDDSRSSPGVSGAPRWVEEEWLAAEQAVVNIARGEAGVRLRVGELLDVLFLRGGHRELGFSSFAGYVVERCQRSGSWGRDVRGLAERLRERSLTRIRAAVLRGELGTSMADLISKYATAENEADLLARARVSTVRAMRAELSGKSLEECARAEGDDRVRATHWVRPEDLAAVTASRMLVEYLTNGARSDEAFVEALLGEGETTLLGILERAGSATSSEGGPQVRRSIDALIADGGGLVERLGLVRASSLAGPGSDAQSSSSSDPASVEGAPSSPPAPNPQGPPPGSCTSSEAPNLRLVPAEPAHSPFGGNAEHAPIGGEPRAEEPVRRAFATGSAASAHVANHAQSLVDDPPIPTSLRALDYAILERCAELTIRGVELARQLHSLANTRLWRVLGFESVFDWASERLGLSRSSFEHHLTLARRMVANPVLGGALEEGRIGNEAALQIGRAVGRSPAEGLVEAWIDRAERRTVKHLREEVRAVVLATTYDPAVSRRPPSDEDLEAVAAFERKVQSGEVIRPYALAGVPSPQMFVTLSPVDAPAGGGRATAEATSNASGGSTVDAPEGSTGESTERSTEGSTEGSTKRSTEGSTDGASARAASEPAARGIAAESGSAARGLRPLRLTISTELYAHFQSVAELYRSVSTEPQTFVGFLCAALWESWLPYLDAWDDKWKHVFRRDLHRCTNPVCERHDVTAHHLRFQARGGGHEPENLTSLCPECHLEGIHAGRLRAEGRASELTWTIGRPPILRVRGREKLAL